MVPSSTTPIISVPPSRPFMNAATVFSVALSSGLNVSPESAWARSIAVYSRKIVVTSPSVPSRVTEPSKLFCSFRRVNSTSGSTATDPSAFTNAARALWWQSRKQKRVLISQDRQAAVEGGDFRASAGGKSSEVRVGHLAMSDHAQKHVVAVGKLIRPELVALVLIQQSQRVECVLSTRDSNQETDQ